MILPIIASVERAATGCAEVQWPLVWVSGLSAQITYKLVSRTVIMNKVYMLGLTGGFFCPWFRFY
jgi:hypothetical protein